MRPSTRPKNALWLNFLILTAFCAGLFAVSLRNIRQKWIA